LLRDFDDLSLTAEARQYLDEAVQEGIARYETKLFTGTRNFASGFFTTVLFLFFP
jgi:hypothetical protein